MAGGIDWFRWHHGSVTDPKFGLVAKRANARRGDVIAIWAHLLEQASQSTDRGSFGDIDCDSIDLLLDCDEGTTAAVMIALEARGLTKDGRIAKWSERQPKREDESAADRQRRKRERDHELAVASIVTEDVSRNVTQKSCDVTHGHDRGEERREELLPTPDGVGGTEADASQPIDDGMPQCPHREIIAAFHAALPGARHVREWTPARASLLRTRWREKRNRQKLAWWVEFFGYVAQSPFLTGQAASTGRKPFELGLEWLLKSENFAKVVEGAYHEEETA